MKFEEASKGDVDRAVDAAHAAARDYRQVPPAQRAAFLERIAQELERSSDLLEVAHAETALPPARLAGERARTTGQLRLFADLVREGSWVDASIDRALPGASNFPLAFSVAGATGMPPGVFSLIQSTRNEVAIALVQHPHTALPGTMLYPALLDSYNADVLRLSTVAGTTTVCSTADAGQGVCALPALIDTTAETFLQHRELSQEVFGPSTVLVRCGSRDEMEAAAHSLEGQLTATLHATATDLADHAQLVSMLEGKAGRLIVNDFPTGVEVCASMQHGGPYPATTDARTTSVGTAAIHRFARPVAYQNFPQPSLPAALQDANPRRIWRRVDGELTKDPL